MSDAPQAPDWWLASDGKWYPPTAPAPPPPPPPPASTPIPPAPGWWLAADGQWYPPQPDQPVASAGPVSVSSGLSGTLQGFLWASGGLALIGAILAFVGLSRFEEWRDAPIASRERARAFDDMTSTDEAINGMIGLAGTAGLVVFILLIIWMNQAHKATKRLWPGPRTWSSGWTVGAWFIPLANAVIPKLVFNEIERIALAPRTGGVVQDGWQRRSTLVIGWGWWLLFVSGLLIGTIGFGLFDEPGGSVTSWRAGYWMTAAGYGAVGVASAFGALYVRRIARSLSTAGDAHGH